MEVKVELVPVGPTKREAEARRLILTEIRKSCEVGRASNNPYKTMLAPTKTNAMIDSPIMSRQHARFTLVKNPTGVELQDLGSTHGTFVDGGRKLQPHTAYRLHSGEQITFGTKVVNGIHEHDAKTFRVFHNAKDIETSQPNQEASRPCPMLLLESDESDSDEGSIIVEKEVTKKTIQTRGFTVPTSEDDEDCDSNDPDVDEDMFPRDNDTSNITTPEKAAEVHKLTSNTVYPGRALVDDDDDDDDEQPGSSQSNPIELEPKASRFGYISPAVLTRDDDDDMGGSVQDKEMMDILLEHEQSQEPVDEDPIRHEPSKAPSPPPRPVHPLSAILNEPAELPSERKTIPETQVEPTTLNAQDGNALPLTESDSEESESESESALNDVPEITFPSLLPHSGNHTAVVAAETHALRTPSPSDAAMAKSKQARNSSLATYTNPTPLPHIEEYMTYPSYPVPMSYGGQYWGMLGSGTQHQEALYPGSAWYEPMEPFTGRSPGRPHNVHPPEVHEWCGPKSSEASNAGSTTTPDAQPSTKDKAAPQILHDSSRLHISNLINDSQKAADMPETSYQRSYKRKADDISRDEDLVLAGDLLPDYQYEVDAFPAERTRLKPAPESSSLRCSEYGPGRRSPSRSSFRPITFETVTRQVATPQTQDEATTTPQISTTKTVQVQAPSPDVTAGAPSKPAQAPLIIKQDVVKAVTQPSTGQPPSKRRRIAGGIAKFVGSAAVGAVGVVAALIAFAPQDVQQEAWREMYH